MTTRGRPPKTLNPNDIQTLELFLQQQPYLKKNQQQALNLLTTSSSTFDEQQLKLLKTVDREKNQFQQRQALIQHIQLKQKNQQALLSTEIEILGLLNQEMDRDNFFRLDRALESYQKIEKAERDNRIRIDNEKRRELIQNTHKELTEAQKKRNSENQLKYALGGAVLAAWKYLNLSTENMDPQKVQNQIINNHIFYTVMRKTLLYQDIYAQTQNYLETWKLLPQILNALAEIEQNGEKIHLMELKKRYKPQ